MPGFDYDQEVGDSMVGVFSLPSPHELSDSSINVLE